MSVGRHREGARHELEPARWWEPAAAHPRTAAGLLLGPTLVGLLTLAGPLLTGGVLLALTVAAPMVALTRCACDGCGPWCPHPTDCAGLAMGTTGFCEGCEARREAYLAEQAPRFAAPLRYAPSAEPAS